MSRPLIFLSDARRAARKAQLLLSIARDHTERTDGEFRAAARGQVRNAIDHLQDALACALQLLKEYEE